MTRDDFNAFCNRLAATEHVKQWGRSDVWKVGGKVFAIATGREDTPNIAFKVSDVAFEMLKTAPGLRPSPYLASRSGTWIQRIDKTSLSDMALKDRLRESHAIIASGLPKRTRLALGLRDNPKQ
jgi:predicted DNA-binding protein (MmcQ/YjbR family)